MGVLQREYGISRDECLWKYSYDELQELIGQLPPDRLIKTNKNDTKADLERKWLETIADFDHDKIKKDKQSYDDKVKIMKLRSEIKKTTDPVKKEGLERQLVKLQGE